MDRRKQRQANRRESGNRLPPPERRRRRIEPQDSHDAPTHKSRSFLRQLLRLIFMLGFFFILSIFLGSIFLKDEVRGLLARKITESSSVILSRPYPITLETNITKARIVSRLERLQYKKAEETPSQAGEYKITNEQFLIYLRTSLIKPEEYQKEGLYKATLNQEGQITEISETSTGKEVNLIWLEPEILSVLGNSSERAISRKTLTEFSPDLKNAILAIEDEHFYYHYGINPLAIIRAFLVNLKAGSFIQGGSTITQQLAKNLLFSSERSILRKVKEAIASILIEMSYSKDQIFEMYMNEIFLGQEGNFAIHGFAEAGKSFFGHDVDKLTLSES